MKLHLLLSTGLLVVLLGCDQKGTVNSTKERATAEQEANNDVENRNLAEKAGKMESELADKHYFYTAMAGQYQGSVRVGTDNYHIKFNIVVSIPPYAGNRVRQLSEIENDLNNLFFHIQVVQWHPDDKATAVGCRVSEVRPNIQTGMTSISSSDCPNLYTIYLSELQSPTVKWSDRASRVANKINGKEIKLVEALVGNLQPSSNAATYSFSAIRID